MAHTEISIFAGFPPEYAKDWASIQPTKSLSANQSPHPNSDLIHHLNTTNNISNINYYADHITSSPDIAKGVLNHTSGILSSIFPIQLLSKTTRVVSYFANVGKLAGIFKGAIDLTSFSYEKETGERFWQQVSLSSAKILGIYQGASDLVSLAASKYATALSQISGAISVAAAPIVGMHTYNTVNDSLKMLTLGQKISSIADSGLTEAKLYELGELFLHRKEGPFVNTWLYHKDHYGWIQENISTKKFTRLVNSILRLDREAQISKKELEELEKIAKKTAFNLKFSSATYSLGAVSGSLTASYGAGSMLIGAKLASMKTLGALATFGFSTLSGALFIAGSTYTAYEGYKYLVRNMQSV